MELTPKRMKRLINLYPPYLGAGVRVDYIREDWKELHVSMGLRWFNKNAVGTHFGGSLYSMVDPHLMLLLMQLLGDGYRVWDQSASIEFLKASKRKVSSVIRITDENLESIRRHTENGEKHLSQFEVNIVDEDNVLVAKVQKIIYVRRKSTSSG